MNPDWSPHEWHDCKVHGHANKTDTTRCYVCDGGLGGCVTCGQWEGGIAHQDLCPGVKPDSYSAMNTLLAYHYEVAPVFRPATQGDLHAGKYVVIFDAGAWQYPGCVEACEGDRYSVACPYGTGGRMILGLEWAPGYPALGVYDPYNAKADDQD